MDSVFHTILTSIWAPATYAKLLFLAVTAPFWLPLAKVMYREILPALNEHGEGNTRRLPPGENPFLNIPLASYRTRRAQANARASRRP